MNFIFKMAWRDSRASRRRLVLASFSIVLGIAALVAIGSFNHNLIHAINGQAKTLLGADLRVQTRSEFSAELTQALDNLGGRQAGEIALSTMVVFPTAENRTRRHRCGLWNPVTRITASLKRCRLMLLPDWPRGGRSRFWRSR